MRKNYVLEFNPSRASSLRVGKRLYDQPEEESENGTITAFRQVIEELLVKIIFSI